MAKDSKVERSILESQTLQTSFTPEEKRVFNKIKRSLMKTFIKPNFSVKMLVDLSASEYILYARNMKKSEVDETTILKISKSIRENMEELDLSPKSKKSNEVSTTLSQIFKTINGGN